MHQLGSIIIALVVLLASCRLPLEQVAAIGPTTNQSVEPSPATSATPSIPVGDHTTTRSPIAGIGTGALIATVAGTLIPPPGTQAMNWGIYNPKKIALDSLGNLFIYAGQQRTVYKVSRSGVITTVAGNGTEGYSGDGGPATSAQLNDPSGVAVDGAGNLYIADNFNRRIRKVDTNGIITTVAGNGEWGYSGDGGPATSAQLGGAAGVAVDGAG
ncbi:MAG: hypothetical protein HY692_08950, partial [Cyanobacteria bacterium NC_groundwater_1444_Ag_S-0.65um_54_12]|nr:hypothetical protein [Cyanobacteria bacterium NC_groundwater_1444_Ag_S-0.65um_54_12]